jgi:hypothetical protein
MPRYFRLKRRFVSSSSPLGEHIKLTGDEDAKKSRLLSADFADFASSWRVKKT